MTPVYVACTHIMLLYSIICLSQSIILLNNLFLQDVWHTERPQGIHRDSFSQTVVPSIAKTCIVNNTLSVSVRDWWVPVSPFASSLCHLVYCCSTLYNLFGLRQEVHCSSLPRPQLVKLMHQHLSIMIINNIIRILPGDHCPPTDMEEERWVSNRNWTHL